MKFENEGKPWDRLDLRYVIVLYNERYTVNGIAERLGRTEKEVYAKIRQLRNKKILTLLKKVFVTIIVLNASIMIAL